MQVNESEPILESPIVSEQLLTEPNPGKKSFVWKLEHTMVVVLIITITGLLLAFIPLATLRQNKYQFIESVQQSYEACQTFLKLNKNQVDKNYECPPQPTNLNDLSYFQLQDLSISYQVKLDQVKMDVGADSQTIADKLEQYRKDFQNRREVLLKLGAAEMALQEPDQKLKVSDQLAAFELLNQKQNFRNLIIIKNIEAKRLRLLQKQKIMEKLGLGSIEGIDQLKAELLSKPVEQALNPAAAEELNKFSQQLTSLISKAEEKIHQKTLADPQAKAEATSIKISEDKVILPVLLYHRIENYESLDAKLKTPARRSLSISPENFKAQLDLIQQKGYETVTLSQVSEAYLKQDKDFFKKKIIVLTFDDAYIEHYQIVYPELKKRDMKGVFGVVTSYLADNSPVSMSWDMVKQMSKDGMQMVSHTYSHCALGSYKPTDGRLTPEGGNFRKCDLTKQAELTYGQVGKELMPKQQVEFEITQSRELLEKNLNQDLPYIIYPYGSYNTQTLDILAAHGFITGLTVGDGPDNYLETPLEVNRITVPGSDDSSNWGGWLNELKNN
ncbi:MAG: hypothetical protein OHK0017_03980 [Patescibacteria group bacterium]